MTTRRDFIAAGAAALLLLTRPLAAKPVQRVVVAGSALTEFVAALDAADRLVGVDTSSIYPAAAVRDLPKIGYFRQLGAEGILALDPTLLLATDQAGPPSTLDQLRAARLPVVLVPESFRIEDVPQKAGAVAAALGLQRGAAMAEGIAADIAAVQTMTAGLRARPRVLFLLSAAGERLLGAGRNTAADAMIGFAGGRNALESFDSYKPVSPEAALAADPDFVLLPSHVAEAAGGVEALAAMPQLKHLRAVREGRIASMSTAYLLGLGPRTAHAGRDLAALLHRDAKLPVLPARSWSA